MESRLDFIEDLSNYIDHVSRLVDVWFDEDKDVRSYIPENRGWSIDQILEHISQTSHFLLILISKGVRKSLNKFEQRNSEMLLENYSFKTSKLEEIGQHLSFNWVRPEHMEPKGEMRLEEVRNIIKRQFADCQSHLEKISKGQGVFHTIRMTVNDLGKIDVYQYLYFLGKHAERHVGQMRKVKEEYLVIYN